MGQRGHTAARPQHRQTWDRTPHMLLEKEGTEDGDRSRAALNTACCALHVGGRRAGGAEAGGPSPWPEPPASVTTVHDSRVEVAEC